MTGGRRPSQGSVPLQRPLPGSFPKGPEGYVLSSTQMPCFQASVTKAWAHQTPPTSPTPQQSPSIPLLPPGFPSARHYIPAQQKMAKKPRKKAAKNKAVANRASMPLRETQTTVAKTTVAENTVAEAVAKGVAKQLQEDQTTVVETTVTSGTSVPAMEGAEGRSRSGVKVGVSGAGFLYFVPSGALTCGASDGRASTESAQRLPPVAIECLTEETPRLPPVATDCSTGLGLELSARLDDSGRPMFRSHFRLRRKTTPATAPTLAELADALQGVQNAEEVGYAFGLSDDDSNPGSLHPPADRESLQSFSVANVCPSQVEKGGPEQPLNWWKSACSSGVDLREQPDVNLEPVPGIFISCGDCFLVSHEHEGTDGVLYLKLYKSGQPWEADSGALASPPLWAFDRLPGAQEPMAVRYMQL